MAHTFRMTAPGLGRARRRRRGLLTVVLVVHCGALGVAASQATTTGASPSAATLADRGARPSALAAGSSDDRYPVLDVDPKLLAGPVPSLQPLFPSASPSPRPSPSAQPVRTAPPQDRWALIVGVTDYRSPVHDTVAGASDARLVRDVLLRSGWRSDHIRVLTDGAATSGALSAGLEWLAARSGPGTFSLMHYSGHVKQRNGHEYLWPVDNGFLSDTSFVAAMKAVRGRSWTSIAGCEAAGFNDGLASAQRLFSASSAVDEKSYEHPDWGLSVWSGVLWKQGLRDKHADADGDGAVSVQEAVRWGAPRAATITDRQRPHGPQHPVLAGVGSPLYLNAPALD